MDTTIDIETPFTIELHGSPASEFAAATEAARTVLDATRDKWQAYEAFKRALPTMGADEYEAAIRGIAQELGL